MTTHRLLAADPTVFADTVNDRGWATSEPLIDGATVAALREIVAALAVDGRGGARNLLADDRIRLLLLHASAPATKPGHRRVIHIECAARALDQPLMWHDRVD